VITVDIFEFTNIISLLTSRDMPKNMGAGWRTLSHPDPNGGDEMRTLLPALGLGLGLAASPALAADPNLARQLAATCANCHGTDGRALGDHKPLAGVPADRILALLSDYRDGKQPATIMHQIAKGYTEEQLRLIAGYLAAQPPQR
jgi:cytochrome subunit of sulfide dehydrogenase